MFSECSEWKFLFTLHWELNHRNTVPDLDPKIATFLFSKNLNEINRRAAMLKIIKTRRRVFSCLRWITLDVLSLIIQPGMSKREFRSKTRIIVNISPSEIFKRMLNNEELKMIEMSFTNSGEVPQTEQELMTVPQIKSTAIWQGRYWQEIYWQGNMYKK